MPEEGAKSIFTSKMFWTNVIGLVAMLIQGLTGSEWLMDIEKQGMILSGINILLRSVTKSPVTWG